MVEGKCTYMLPFDVCKFCPNLSVDVRVQDITGDGKVIARGITVVCSREPICRNFYEMLEEDKDSFVWKAMDESQN